MQGNKNKYRPGCELVQSGAFPSGGAGALDQAAGVEFPSKSTQVVPQTRDLERKKLCLGRLS